MPPPLLAALTLGLTATLATQQPDPPFAIVSPQANPDTTVAIDLNHLGQLIGLEWVEPADRPGEIHEKPFFLAQDGQVTYLPNLEGYSATHPAALSDTGHVVGRVSKPAPLGVSVPLRNQAFVWHPQTGIQGLGTLPDDNASVACGISGDGRRISGYSVGNGRIRPCYWERQADRWTPTALPAEASLGSNVVALSDDGRHVAAVDGQVPCLWTEEAPGRWIRQVLGPPGSLIPRAVNNRGTVVGLRYNPDGTTEAVFWTPDQAIQLLPKPKGFTRAEASALNNAGVIVGTLDGPAGSLLGPRGFAFENGALQLLESAGLPLTAATAINDHRQVAGILEKPEDPDNQPPFPDPNPKPPASPPADHP
jgi:hypothetical protein